MRTAIILASLLCVGLCVGGIAGAWQSHNFDAENNEVDRMALDATLTNLRKQGNMEGNYEFKGVERCEIQFVSGMKYRLTLNFLNAAGEARQYEAVVYLVPWEQHVEVQSVRDVTSSNMSGDLQQNSALREEILSYIDQQLRMRVNHDLSNYQLTNYEVLGMQVVQGNVYELRVDFSNAQDTNAAPVSYKVSVWVRPWLNPALEITDISDYTPSAEEKEKPLLTMYGFYTDREWEANGELENSALQALNAYALENVAPDFVMGAVKSAKSQVVSGVNFKITFDYTSNGEQKFAEAVIYLQPWTSTAVVTSFNEL